MKAWKISNNNSVLTSILFNAKIPNNFKEQLIVHYIMQQKSFLFFDSTAKLEA